MKVELVSHCWRYGRMLRYQLSSLFLFPPERVAVEALVFCASREDDAETWETLDYFLGLGPRENVTVRPWTLAPERLFRRAIGRNLAAQETTADWVWFADCDMTFRQGVFDGLAETLGERSERLFYPREIFLHRTHALGDAAVERAGGTPGLIDIAPEEFAVHRYRRAIGGVQIVPARVAREVGYCPNGRWQQPAARWQRARDDVAFRASLGTPGVGVSIPNVFRLRHSVCGRMHPEARL
jgi:hypothetical protein